MSIKKLSVRLHGEPLGTLEQAESGKLRFHYEKAALRSLSLSMPLSEKRFEDEACEAYFGGLLPESQQARLLIAKKYGANARNTFSLLKAIGYDCAGAVSLHSLTEAVKAAKTFQLQAKALSDKALAQHIRELPKKPLFLGAEGLRISLAGAQDKAAVCLMDGQIALPLEGTPTTHLLKPGIAGLEATVENEWLCMTLAKQIGLDVPIVEIREAEGVPYLLISRYDRRFVEGECIERIHQEDFCQALGVPSSLKYQADGGPVLKDCFQLLHKVSQPAKARTTLLKMVVFNALIGNCDAHAKNFSLLHHDDGSTQLAPAYDLLCTSHYEMTTSKMAMKLGGKYKLKEVFPRHWEAFAEECSLSPSLVRKTLSSVSEQLSKAVHVLRPEKKDEIYKAIFDTIEKNIEEQTSRFN